MLLERIITLPQQDESQIRETFSKLKKVSKIATLVASAFMLIGAGAAYKGLSENDNQTSYDEYGKIMVSNKSNVDDALTLGGTFIIVGSAFLATTSLALYGSIKVSESVIRPEDRDKKPQTSF